MKPVLAWVKSNLIIVIAMSLALIAIPVSLFFSGNMSAKLRDAVQKDVSGVVSQLNGLAVEYTIPPSMPGEEPWSLRASPNQVRNQAVESVLKTLTTQSEAVRTQAQRRNQGDKRLLLSGTSPENRLFPEPANESARVRLLTEMAEKWFEAHQTMLTEARAGMPPDQRDLVAQLESQRTRLAHGIVSGRVNQELDDQEKADIAAKLAEERRAAYQSQAQRIAFYADRSVFTGVEPWSSDRGLPRLEQAWEWQWVYWVHRDLISAIARANSEPGKPWIPVPSAPVKRILEIRVEPFGATESGATDLGGRGRGGSDEEEMGSGVASVDPDAPIEANFSVSPTGRAGWPVAPNGLYDVRYATITLIVDANRIPTVLNAIADTNFMSVADLDIAAFDRFGDLSDGFFYGPDPLVIATIRVESVWMRSWMTPWMPPSIRAQLGIPADAPATDADPDA